MFVTVLISLCVITKGFKRISDHNAEKEGTIRVCLSICVFSSVHVYVVVVKCRQGHYSTWCSLAYLF